MTRVFATGIGAITPLGIGREALWAGLTSGRSGIRTIESFDTSDLDVTIGGEVRDFTATDFINARAARRMDRFSQLGVAAAREAVEHAGLAITPENTDRIGVMMNTGGGGIISFYNDTMVMLADGPKRVSPFLIPNYAPNMASCQVAMQLGIHGPTVTSVAACAAGVQAFVDAVHLIQRGDADVVITGGTEAGLTKVALASLSNMGALSRRNDDPAGASRPFDLDRDGFVFSEGAGVAVLESEEHAVRRGVTPLVEVFGGAYTSDAYHITSPHPEGRGATRAMRNALQRAQLGPADIDFIAAHATATKAGDIAETVSIRSVFGEHADGISVSANKSMLGHLLGAAGAISAIGCMMAIQDGMVPPTINLETPDPACDLDYTPNVARKREVRHAMANGFGFGGQNAVAIFGRIDG